MFGSPWNTRRKACLLASSSRPEPGSVIATKLLPCSTSEKKCANSDSGSIVPPDFEETMNSVRRRSSARSTVWIRAASVESSTCSRALPSRPSNARRRTSGASEEPPIPSSTMSCISSSCTSAANSSSAPSSPSVRSAIVSQPRRLATSGVGGDPVDPHSVASPSRSRSLTRACAAAASLSSTVALSASGMRASTVRVESLTPRS